MRLKLGLLAVAAVAATVTFAATPASAQAASTSCPASTPYPGDAGAREDIAAWMGARAIAVGLPPELSVMAALVESNLTNVDDSGSGYAGYFQMSRRYFDTGPFAGFPDRPELQIRWFTETANTVRDQRLAGGKPDPQLDETTWGEWIADVEKPAAQYRSRYQLRLAEARELLGDGCTGTAGPTDPGESVLELWGGTEQTLNRKVRVALVCPTDCVASASGTLRMPDAGSRYALGGASASGVGGEKIRLALTLPQPTLRAARRALRRGEPVRARIDISATGADGSEASGRRNVKIEIG